MEEAALRRKVRLDSGYDIPLNHRRIYLFYAECEELGCRYQCKLGIFLKLCSANMPGPSSWIESPATPRICLSLEHTPGGLETGVSNVSGASRGSEAFATKLDG